MDFLKDNPKKLFFRFLTASTLSALVVSIYAFVDTIAVGQSEGPLGTAAMAIVTPFYGVFAFFSILVGIGGSVQMSKSKGEGNNEKGNAYFTTATILISIITVLIWLIMIFFYKPIFTFFGANEEVMPYVISYAQWLIYFFPFFIAPTFLGAFIRNDGAPNLVMSAVITGGCINIFGDWFFVFPLGFGMSGAGIATVIGVIVQTIIMSAHFFRKKCNLRLVKPHSFLKGLGKILRVGFGSGIIELGTVIIAILMNNQIMNYGSNTELAIYGVLITIFQLFTAVFSGIGQAIQPLVSSNYGAKNFNRNKTFLKMSFITTIIFGIIFTLLGELLPIQISKIFIATTDEIIKAAPLIFRLFFIVYIPLGISILSIYYLQSTMHHKQALLISFLKGILISSSLILLLPLILDINGVLIALPCSELIVSILSIVFLFMSFKNSNKVY